MGFKEAELLGEKGDSRSGAGNIQDLSAMPCHTRKQGSFDILLCLKRTQAT